MKKLRTQRVLQEGFITFFEIIKAILMGIVEGITAVSYTHLTLPTKLEV